jgi:3-dehydroquinate synthase
MDMANYVSVKRGYLTETIRMEIRSVLEKIWTGFDISNIDVAKFVVALSKDKKNVGTELRLILCKGYGEVFKTSQKLDEEFIGWLEEYFRNELA